MEQGKTVTDWKEILLNTKCSRCPRDRRRRSECQRWDEIHQEDPTQSTAINLRRRNDHDNFKQWLSSLCRLCYGELSPVLTALDKAGFCMPCLARAVYSLLRYEWIDPYMFTHEASVAVKLSEAQWGIPTDSTNELELPNISKRGSSELSKRVVDSRGLRHQLQSRMRAAVRAGLYHRVFRPRWIAQARPCYKEMAVLLNLGKSFETHFKPGILGVADFTQIDSDFTPEMLRQRATTGELVKSLLVFFFVIPLSAWRDLPAYLGPLLPFRRVFNRRSARR